MKNDYELNNAQEDGWRAKQCPQGGHFSIFHLNPKCHKIPVGISPKIKLKAFFAKHFH